MADDALSRIDARLGAAPQGGDVADRIAGRIGTPTAEEPILTPSPAAQVFQTAGTGGRQGAAVARERIVAPTKSTFTKTIEAMYRAIVPNVMQDPRTGPPAKEGLSPTLEQIQKAAMKDPEVARLYYEEWLRGQAAELTMKDPVWKAFQGTTPEPTARTWLQPPQEPSVQQVATSDDLRKRVFERLTRAAAEPEQKYQKEHPWLAATVEIPGETIRMLPAIAAAAATGGAGIVPAAVAFDVVSQAQRIKAGGQQEWSPSQSVVNMISMFAGAGAGSLAEKLGASRAAQILAANTGMLGTPTAIDIATKVGSKEQLDWQELARQLYKGVAEAGFLSAAHLSAAHQPSQDAILARDMAAQHALGERALTDTVAALEAHLKERGNVQSSAQTQPAEINPANAVKSAEAAVLRAGEPPEQLRQSREQRRAILEAGMRPGAKPDDAALWDAMKALELDMKQEPPGSARRLYLGSEEYAGRLADQFGVTDDANRKMLRELGSDLILEPHPRAEKQAGAFRLGTTEAERAEIAKERLTVAQEHQRVLAEAPERLRQMTNDFVKRLIRMTGREPTERPFMARTDPGFEEAHARNAVEVENLRRQLKDVARQHYELMKATPHAPTMDRILTLAAMSGPEEGASVALKTLPENLRAPVVKFLGDYAEIAKKYGVASAAAGRIPEARWAVPYYDEAGKPQVRIVATRPGEMPPPGGDIAGLGHPWLIGGRQMYEGRYVHQTYERPKGTGFFKKREPNVMGAISGPAPSSSHARLKTAQEFIEQGILKLEPTFKELAAQGRDIHRLKDLDYLRDERPDLYLTKSDFKGNVEQTYLKQIEQAGDRLKEVDKLIKAHTKEMVKRGQPIYAGEAGELTKAMARNRARISRDLHAHMKEMSARAIPVSGWPEGFDPQAKGSGRRAREIRVAQRRYDLLAKQLWTHARVERPTEELFGVKQLFGPGEVEANLKLRQLYDEKIRLQNIATSTWIELKPSGDMRFGPHTGNYVRSDALRDISFEHEAADNSLSLYDALTGLFKWSRVPGNPARSFVTQMLGNAMMASVGGVEFTIKGVGHWLTATQHAFQYLWSDGKSAPSDPLFHELVDTARVHGPLALYDAPVFAKERVLKALDAANEAWKNSEVGTAIKLWTVALLRAAPYYASKIPIFGKATRLVTAMDLIPQYAMYRQLRSGDGSTIGQLGMEEALTHTGAFYDMGDIPRWLERYVHGPVTKYIAPTFARFAYKAPTALVKWMMASPPTLGTYMLPGLKIPEAMMSPLHDFIVENAGTPAATKAIWVTKATNLTLNVLKLASHLAAAEWIACKRLGIDMDDPEYKRRKLAEARGSYIRALFLKPIDIDAEGNIRFWDFFNLAPGTNILNLGQTPDDIHGLGMFARATQFILSLNWLTNLGFHLATQTDYRGRNQSWQKSLLDGAANFLPGGFEMPARALYRAAQTNSQQGSVEALFQALTGITIRVAQPGEESAQDLRDLAEGGHIKTVEDWQPTDAEGKLGLKLYNMNPYNRMRAINRALERLK